jgi:hypothetical protein
MVPIDNQPAPKLTVEAPLPGPLAQSVVYIPYRVENLRIMPLGGSAGTQFVAARRALAYHRRRPAVVMGGLRSEQHSHSGEAAALAA